jgi:hypothetical protein
MRRVAVPTFILLGCIAASLVYVHPIFRQWGNWGIQDWDQHLFYQAVPRDTLLRYHQVPLWNPYYCGGTVMLANPQSRFLSPSFLLVLLFGTLPGVKLEIALHVVIGLGGAYLLARRYELEPVPALAAAAVFMLSSMYALNLTVGMTWFMSVAYVPWAVFFYLKSFDRLGYVALSAVCLALMYFDGGAYPLPITLLFLLVLSACMVARRGPRQPALRFGGTVVLTLCFGAVKLIPSIEFMIRHPRKWGEPSGYSLMSLAHSLLDRDQTIAAAERFTREEGFWSGVSGYMDENGMYIGALGMLLAFAGLVRHGRRRWELAVCLALFLWLGFGDRIFPSLWGALRTLPVFDSMRVAQRFRIIFMLCLALFAGLGVQALRDLAASRFRTAWAGAVGSAGLALVLVADLLAVNSPVLCDAFTAAPVTVSRPEGAAPGSFVQVSKVPSYGRIVPGLTYGRRLYRSYGGLYPAFLANVGVIDAYETANVPREAVPSGSPAYRGEVYLVGMEGRAWFETWTPNRLVIGVQAAGPGWLVVNQNYDAGWKEAHGRSVKPLYRLIGMRVGPGDTRVELQYCPTSFLVGAAVTGLTLLVACGVACAAWITQYRTGRTNRAKGARPDALMDRSDE